MLCVGAKGGKGEGDSEGASLGAAHAVFQAPSLCFIPGSEPEFADPGNGPEAWKSVVVEKEGGILCARWETGSNQSRSCTSYKSGVYAKICGTASWGISLVNHGGPLRNNPSLAPFLIKTKLCLLF